MSGQTNTVWNCHYYEPPSRILSEAFEAMFHLWPITLVLVLPSLLFIVNAPRKLIGLKFSRRHLCIFIPIVITLLMTMAGSAVLDSLQNSTSPTPGWLFGIVWLVLLVQLAVCCWIVIWWIKDYRALTAFAITVQFWFTLLCGFTLLDLLCNYP